MVSDPRVSMPGRRACTKTPNTYSNRISNIFRIPIQPFIYLFISMDFNSDLLVFIYCIFTLKCLLMGPTPGMPSFKNSATGTPFISVTVPVQLLHYLIILSRSTVSGWYIILWSYQRKLGSNTSELRMTFTWCNWLWWRVVDHVTIHNVPIHHKRIRSNEIDLEEGW